MSEKENIISYAKKVVEKEIKGIRNLQNNIDNNFIEVIFSLVNCRGKIVVMGIGKSGHIGKKIAATLASTGTPSFFVHGDEALHGDLGMVEKNDIIIALSNSGETKEVINSFPTLKKIGCKIISITSNSSSTIAQNSDTHICIGKLKEADHLGLAPTTSSTATLVIGDAIALTLSYLKSFKKEDFALYHPGGSLGKELTGKEI